MHSPARLQSQVELEAWEGVWAAACGSLEAMCLSHADIMMHCRRCCRRATRC